MRKLFQILCKHKLSISIISIMIILLSYVGISTMMGNLVLHYANDSCVLGPEMLSESGPNFKKVIKDQIQMLETYTYHMEDKYTVKFLRAFHNEYSPTKGFERALTTLKKAKDGSQEECARAIWLAGGQVEQYRMKASIFPNLFPLVRYKNITDELMEDIKTALKKSDDSLKHFQKNQFLKFAVSSCEDDRWTMLLLYLGRADYTNSDYRKLFDEFQGIVKKAQESEKALSESNELPEGDPTKRFLDHIIQSEQRRLDVLETIKIGDMNKARTLMWEAIEKAYNERPIMLELAREVGFGEEWNNTNP